MRKFLDQLQNPRYIPLVGLGAATLIWWTDALIDHFMFHADSPFIDSFWPDDEPQELWMRLLATSLFVGISFYARLLIQRETRAKDALAAHQSKLEEIIAARTQELEHNYSALQQEMTERQQAQAQLEILASTDPLTRLYNRRKFEELLNHELERSRRYPSEFALILFDVDHFKRVNDEYGHDVGDGVLKFLAEIVRSQLRKSDIVARWGGEEFLVLVPEADADTAVAIAEKLRCAVESGQFPRQLHITISLGVSLARRNDSANSLVKRADQALYRAKQTGRNRVILEAPEPPQQTIDTPL